MGKYYDYGYVFFEVFKSDGVSLRIRWAILKKSLNGIGVSKVGVCTPNLASQISFPFLVLRNLYLYIDLLKQVQAHRTHGKGTRYKTFPRQEKGDCEEIPMISFQPSVQEDKIYFDLSIKPRIRMINRVKVFLRHGWDPRLPIIRKDMMATKLIEGQVCRAPL